MVRLTFNHALLRVMVRCRYGVYLAILGLLVLQAWRMMAPLSAGVVYFVLAPALMHTFLKVGRGHGLKALVWSHCLEFAGLLAALLLTGATSGTLFAVVFVCVASNALLWSVRALPALLIVGAVGAGCAYALLTDFSAPAAVRLNQDRVVDAAAWGLACFGVVVICCLSHWHARRLLFGRRALQMEKRLLQRYLPRELPAHVAGGNPGRAERLWLTVAFIDLVGFTQATRMLPAEILSCLLNDFFSAVNEHVERHAGSVSKFLGDGVLCVFAPLGVEQRGSTASGCVTCLSELPDLMGRLRRRWRSEGYLHGFTVTAGVASGFCALGDWGSDQRLDYTVIGEPVNLARRLQGVAGDCGGVLIDAVTAELVRPLADVGEEYCLDLKGMDATVGFAPLPSEPNLC